ncbi:MAG: PGPGW domain-containing protein [Planctomycetota bacterium]
MLRLCALAGKNLLAVVLVVAGVAMLFLPGQGILTILVGLGLLSVPGKRKLELWIVRRPAVLRAIQWTPRPVEPPGAATSRAPAYSVMKIHSYTCFSSAWSV